MTIPAKNQFIAWLSKEKACQPAIDWVTENKITTIKMALEKCDDMDWLLWAAQAYGWPSADARLFACWCIRNTPLVDGRMVWDLLNKRIRHAVEIAEKFAKGKATISELTDARAAAWTTSAVWATSAAARAASAATSANDVWDAANSAAGVAATNVASTSDAARLPSGLTLDAANAATSATAWAATSDVARAAWATWVATRNAARATQLKKLKTVLAKFLKGQK